MAGSEDLQNEIQELKEKLAQREEELQLAGTFGKQLLQQSEASNETIQALQNEKATNLNEMEDLKHELEVMRERMGTFASLGLDQAMKKLKDEVARSEKQIQNEKERYRTLQEDHHELQVKEEVLRSQLREAESFTAALQSTTGSLKESKEKLRQSEDVLEKIERENRHLREEMEEMKSKKKRRVRRATGVIGRSESTNQHSQDTFATESHLGGWKLWVEQTVGADRVRSQGTDFSEGGGFESGEDGDWEGSDWVEWV